MRPKNESLLPRPFFYQSFPAFSDQSFFHLPSGFTHNYHPILVTKSSGFITSKIRCSFWMLTESGVVLNLLVTPSSQDRKYWASPAEHSQRAARPAVTT